MDYSWFEEQWTLLVPHATLAEVKEAERFNLKLPSCTMQEAMFLLRTIQKRMSCTNVSLQVPTKQPYVKMTKDDMNHILGHHGDIEGLYYCTKCRTTEFTEYIPVQSRSGDESMSDRIKCTKCGQRWVER